MIDIIGSKSEGLYDITKCNTRAEWLKLRRKFIGASDAAAVIGISPWKTNVQLWNEKHDPADPVEISNPNIERGIKSEAHIRELYSIESGHPVQDGTGMLLSSVNYPFMSATLDGAAMDDDGNPYIVEIKSVNWSRHWKKDCPPDYYFVQVVHQLIVTGWERAVLVARIIMPDKEVVTRNYKILREEVRPLIGGLANREREFFNAKTCPPLIMPTI